MFLFTSGGTSTRAANPALASGKVTAGRFEGPRIANMSANARGSSLKGDVKIGSDCIICVDSEIRGDVTIGNGTIVHPRASIVAEAGPIIIGERNLIEDKAVITNRGGSTSGSTPVMIIGNYNVFEVGAQSEALKIGDYNVLESKSMVGREVVLSNNCIIGAGCTLTTPEVLADNSAYYGPECALRISQGHQPQVLQMDFLSKVLPNYHRLVKKKKTSVKEATSTPA